MANKCIFTGNLCFDIEERQAGQNKVSNNSIAVNETYKGTKKTTFVPVTFWNKQVDLLKTYCQKGSKLLLTCKFEMQEWESNGEKRSKPNFTVLEMEFIGSKNDSQQRQQQYQQPQQNYQDHQVPPSNDDFIESDIPF